MITRQHINAAFVLLGIPLHQADRVVTLHISDGKVEATLIHRDDDGNMVVPKGRGPLLEFWKDEVE